MTGGVIRHGHCFGGQTSPEFKAWGGMKQRCTNPKNPKFSDYGGRGISVCQRWMASFDNFISDMGLRPSAEYSLERKNTDGNYEPSNCIWATREAQQRNRRVNKRVLFRGEDMTLFRAIEATGNIVPYHTVSGRLNQGWSLERALTEAVHAVGRPLVANPTRKRIIA